MISSHDSRICACPWCAWIRKIRRLAFMLVALAGCTPRGLWMQVGYRSNTDQVCLDVPLALSCARRIVARLEMILGFDAIDQWGSPSICMIDRQEPCRLGTTCAAASTEALRCAPRAGCTIHDASWVAMTDSNGLDYDWSNTLEAELKISLANKLGLATSPLHDTVLDQVVTGVRCEI